MLSGFSDNKMVWQIATPEFRQELNRLYSDVYLRVRQELKAARAANKERNTP